MVGKSDVNENPVVSLDLDCTLDFDLGFVNKHNTANRRNSNNDVGKSYQKTKIKQSLRYHRKAKVGSKHYRL